MPSFVSSAVSSGLLAELAELKKAKAQPHKRRFERLDFVVKGIYFINFLDVAIDPFRVAAHILEEVKTTQSTKTRYGMGLHGVGRVGRQMGQRGVHM